MTEIENSDPAMCYTGFDAVAAAPKRHKVIFENDDFRILEVALGPQDEEPLHHHRRPSDFVCDEIHDQVSDISPEGAEVPPSRDVMQAKEARDGQSSHAVNMAPQSPGHVLNKGGTTTHRIRIELKG